MEVKARSGRIAGVVCLVGAALAAALAVGTERSTERARIDRAYLVAHDGARAAAPPGADGERDECTATAGFWGPADGVEAEAGRDGRSRVCKRYA
jgi:hypothetical protein